MLTFRRLKFASFTHSAIYTGLLTVWLLPGLPGAEFVLGMSHGIGWILMCIAAVVAERKRVISLRLAALIALVGGVGPFAGSVGFVLEERRARGAGRGLVIERT